MEKNSTAETNRPQLSFLVCACAFQKPQRKSSGFVVYITPKQFSSKPVQSHKRKTTQKPLQLLPQTVSKTALPKTNNPWRQSDWEAIHPTDYSSSWHGLRDKACVFATSWLWRHRPHNRCLMLRVNPAHPSSSDRKKNQNTGGSETRSLCTQRMLVTNCKQTVSLSENCWIRVNYVISF